MCATISHQGVLHRHAILWPYTVTQCFSLFSLISLRDHIYQFKQREPVVYSSHATWSFGTTQVSIGLLQFVTGSPITPGSTISFYQHISPSSTPQRCFFFFWNGGGRCMTETPTFMLTFSRPCHACQGWIRHVRFPRHYLARANIACDVDEVLLPDPDQRHDAVAE